MRNYFWNYLEEIISKNRGLGLLGNTLRIFAERTFLAAYPLLTLVAHPFFAERTSQSLFAERTLLQNFYECTVHPNPCRPRPLSMNRLDMSRMSKK